MEEPMNTEIVVALAEVRGEIRGLRETSELHMRQQRERLDREVEAANAERALIQNRLNSQSDRMDAHHDRIDSLEAVKDRLWGGAAAIGLTSGLVVGVILLVVEWVLAGGTV